jgi:adenine-specific DNA-methyltransferase
MKYMGSKRWMLQNGLGDLIAREVASAPRFLDLFSGSAAVSTHVALKHPVSVTAFDLQTFSAVLARAVLEREKTIDAERTWTKWLGRARELRSCIYPPSAMSITWATVKHHRRWCANQDWLMTKAYGGYYFSPLQAVWLDSLRQALPDNEPARSTALAALICAASQCAAAPGHTAQPFQPTRTAKPFLADAWRKNIVTHCENVLFVIAQQHAKVRGHANVLDANEAAALVREGDLVFIDPPYSGVHYSRFYHVLETLARGQCSEVSGTGRYPMADERPRSKYSLTSESSDALNTLFKIISSQGGKAIVTFPQRKCSNGLSGRAVLDLARTHFTVERHWVASKFSTLGGNNDYRDARCATRELILVLRPRNAPKASASSATRRQ